MFAGCLQIMWAHYHLMWAEGTLYLQIMWAENHDVCSSWRLCLQAVTVSAALNPLMCHSKSFKHPYRVNQNHSIRTWFLLVFRKSPEIGFNWILKKHKNHSTILLLSRKSVKK